MFKWTFKFRLFPKPYVNFRQACLEQKSGQILKKFPSLYCQVWWHPFQLDVVLDLSDYALECGVCGYEAIF